ncbi:MAG TPA: class I SAM-dependent methyltransferase [Candidatus Limnocylindria bacterium]|nr:class I SAM-dependent methyltransferase [Candidatus Limnocylindria bacterium]
MSEPPDIFAGQPASAELLAELYDLEHDEIVEDLVFYRELAGRTRGAILDLGCGSGRLFSSLLAGGARHVVGLDGSAALLERARRRVAGDPALAAAAAARRLELVHGDVRAVAVGRRFSLIVAVGVLPHLGTPDAVLAMLWSARRRLTPPGRLVLDDLGPGAMPHRDLPLSVDWTRRLGERTLRRSSRLLRSEEAGGLRVDYSTLTESIGADGTIAPLSAEYRLWYPSPDTLSRLAREAGLAVELSFGSHDLDELGPESERRIFILRRTRRTTAAGDTGGGGHRHER